MEALESRNLLSATDVLVAHNGQRPSDVNNDRSVSPLDALIAINFLNRPVIAAAEGGSDGETTVSDAIYVDVDNDGQATPMDVLRIVNSLNDGEGQDTPVMEYILRTFDSTGTNQISTVGVGDQFVLKVFVHDLRNLPPVNGKEQGGVFAAYTDVLYNSALASVANTIQHDTTFYGNSQLGSTATAGVVDGAGSFASALTPPGNAEKLLWSLTFTANATGTLTLDGQPTTDVSDPGDAGQSPSRDTGIYTQDKPVCPSAAQGGCEGDMVHQDVTITIVEDGNAVDDAFTINEDPAAASTFDVLANDQIFNPPNGTKTISAVTQGNNGGVVTNNTTNVSYRPALNFAGQELFTYTLSNGQGFTDVATVTVTVTAVNDPPTVTVPGGQNINEDAALVFSTAAGRAITFGDVDGDINAHVTISATNGKLTVPATAGVTITGNNTANLQLDGVISAINTAVNGNGLTYQPNQDFNGSDSITVNINDNGNTGTGPAGSASGNVAIVIAAVNDAPVNGTPGDQSTDEEVALTMSTANGNALSVSDVDAGNANVSVALSINQGGTLNLASTTGLTVTGNGTTAINITGTLANINSALGNGLTFTPTSGFIGTAAFQIVSNDQGATGSGGAKADTDTFNIDVVPTVRPKALNDTASVDEDVPAGITINVLANDRANDGAQVTLLSFTQPANGTVTRVDNGTPGNTTDDRLLYVAPGNFAGTATFTYTVNDTAGTGDDSTATVAVTVNPINDAPVVTVPGGQNTNEDANLVINGISVADIDAGTANVEVTLAVNNGTVTVGTGGVTVANNGSASVKITGTIANINTVLNGGVTYSSTNNFNGSDNLTVTINDLGNTGAPGPLSDSEIVAITINAVNDPPVNTLPAANTILAIKDQDAILSAANGNAIQIADADAGNANVQVTLTFVHGKGTLANTANVTATGNGTASLVITGSVANINAALAAGLTYRPDAGFVSPPQETLTVVTNDLGNTGSPGPQSDTDSVSFDVQDFIPSEVQGRVFVDTNDNGVQDPLEPGLEGVVILLTGTDFRGQVVDLSTRTGRDGLYRFENLKPGDYTLEEIQPAAMRDGQEVFRDNAATPGGIVVAAGNDKGTFTIPIQGDVHTLANLFAEIGLEANYVRAFDLLASSGDPANSSGIIFGTDANSAWASLIGSDWGTYENVRITVNRTFTSGGYRHAEVTLTVFDTAAGQDRSVTLNSSLTSRLIYIENGTTRVMRFRGRPSDLFVSTGGEGESYSDPAAEAGREYARGVDAVMAQGDALYA